MSAVAIVCEYNPFHTGHAYHIAESKAICGAETVIGVMSGFFVQRAEPAFIIPSVRAKAAVMNGMDCVIQLPTLFSCAAGNVFAEGAVRIISRIPEIKYLAMGTESDGNILREVADIQLKQPPKFLEALKSALNKGLPYAHAIADATTKELNGTAQLSEILAKPNNILAIEYLKAIKKLNAKIEPVFVKRKGNGYNSLKTDGEYISATAARKLFELKDYDTLSKYIPKQSFAAITEEYSRFPVNPFIYDALTVFSLRTNDISLSHDCAEGLDIKISECAKRYASLCDILNAAKSKRYTMGRIKRVCLQTLLGITHDSQRLYEEAAGKVIAVKNDKKSILKKLVGVAIKNTDYKKLGKDAELCAEIDGRAGGIYSLITKRDGNAFWNGKLETV